MQRYVWGKEILLFRKILGTYYLSLKWCVVLKTICDWLRSQTLSRGMGFISTNMNWKNFLLQCVYCYGIESLERNCKGTCLSYDRIEFHDHIVSFNYLNDQCDFCMETNPFISTAKQPDLFQYDEDM